MLAYANLSIIASHPSGTTWIFDCQLSDSGPKPQVEGAFTSIGGRASNQGGICVLPY